MRRTVHGFGEARRERHPVDAPRFHGEAVSVHLRAGRRRQARDLLLPVIATDDGDDPFVGFHAIPSVMARRSSAGVRTSRRSEEHTYELQSRMRISYSVFVLK